MGQTLTHGIYLPDEGERNCYNGLAANWGILDGAVGTVAEHTSQIAGKAPAVHTHTKSDITDFPAYGTTAGTICEGNDSRLSDARTPVAHTHTKSDVTDLFNSENEWTGKQVYKDVINISKVSNSGIRIFNNAVDVTSNTGQPDITDNTSQTFLSFKTKQQTYSLWDFSVSPRTTYTQARIVTRFFTNSSSSKSLGIDFKVDSSGNKNITPTDNNQVDLGSSSYQWNNLYAKNYYYNGVAWGLDKSNVWTGINTFTAVSYGNKIVLKNTGLDLSNGNSGLTDTYLHFIQWVDNSDTVYAMLQGFTKNSNTTTVISNKYKTDANTSVTAELRLENSGTAKSFYSNSNGDTDLGTSSKRWKTLNGINPGALSLPDMSSGTGVSLSAGSNSYSPPSSGWLSINLTGAISVVCGNFCHSGTDMLSVPVVKGSTYTVTVATSGTAYLFVSQGNV